MDIRGFHLERAAARLDPVRDHIDVLRRGELQREAFALCPVQPLGAVVLTDKDPRSPRTQRGRDQLVVASVFTVHGEAEYVAIPG